MSNIVAPVLSPRILPVTLDLSQIAGTYDAATASGDVLITGFSLYVSVAGSLFTTVAIATDALVPYVILAALASASVLAGTNLATTWTQAQPFVLPSGKKIQYTIVGLTGSGTIKAYPIWLPLTAGATLT